MLKNEVGKLRQEKGGEKSLISQGKASILLFYCQQSVSRYEDNYSCIPTSTQLNLIEFFLFGLITQEISNLSHQNYYSFCSSKLMFKKKRKKSEKNSENYFKYTCLENSSKHELEEKLGGIGRKDGSNKLDSPHYITRAEK